MAVTGFLTDSTLCIGCKACEVACKEWNDVPDDGFVWSGLSYDNTLALGHSTYRHVKFVEREPRAGCGGNSNEQLTWEFSSDVCKHCENAGCLEACPTGSIVRTEFGSVFVQPDICNGCGYCVVSCPFGVVDRRPDDGRAFKCTFCYDRQKAGAEPACSKACPTGSILFGRLDDLERAADRRIDQLHSAGMNDATIWNPKETSVGGTHAFFIVRGDPRAYNLPANPKVPATLLRQSWSSAAVAACAMVAVSLVAFALGGGRSAGACPERSRRVPPTGPAEPALSGAEGSRRRGAR
jgi:Fe-S-cluster-containing hydrogenase components 1